MTSGTQIVDFNAPLFAFGQAFTLPFDDVAGESIFAGNEILSAAAIKRVDDDDDDLDEDEDDEVEDDEDEDEDDEYEDDEDEDDEEEDEDEYEDDDEEDADEDEINLI
jgi:hypothetical protein